jgi:predicted Zn-dependent protease
VYAQKAGYDVTLGSVVWERFATSFAQQLATSYVGVTHPTSAERLARVREVAARLSAGTFDESAYAAAKT